MSSTEILGVGSYVPPHVWKNDDLKVFMDTSDEWIQQRTGIQQRHWVDVNSETCTSDLALQASLLALERACIKKEDLDLIILATLSPDHEFPGTACFLQAKLGLSEIPALDIRQQCTGFIYGLSIADQFIRSGMYQRILLVGSEVHSKGLDKSTRGRDVTVLFGDGAGAVVLGRANPQGAEVFSSVLSTHLHADGNFAKELWIEDLGTAHSGERCLQSRLDEGKNFPKMNGKIVFMHAVRRMTEVLLEALNANQHSLGDVDLFVFHQANLRINELVAQQLKIPEEKVFNTIQFYANTTAATIPIGLDQAVQQGRLKKGMLVALVAFGSGFTWGSSLVRW